MLQTFDRDGKLGKHALHTMRLKYAMVKVIIRVPWAHVL